jgi:dienelactone hydrolase
MAEVLLFHHAQGLTDGCAAFADELRGASHVVHAPDLYEGRTFADLDEGIAYAREVGFDTIIERGRRAADDVTNEVVYLGFSLGAMPGQMLAQTREGARGAVLLHSAIPPEEFGGPWPEGLPLQMHIMESDPLAAGEGGDLEVARQLADTIDGAELWLYPGEGHLFADRSLPEYDSGAAALVIRRVLDLLDAVDRPS